MRPCSLPKAPEKTDFFVELTGPRHWTFSTNIKLFKLDGILSCLKNEYDSVGLQ